MSELITARRSASLPFRLIPIALIPGNRAALHQRIAARFEEMLELGLINEVRALRENYDLKASLPSMRCVGYRQAWQYLDGEFGLGHVARQSRCRDAPTGKTPAHLAAGDARTSKRFDCLADDLHEQVGKWLKRNLHAPTS